MKKVIPNPIFLISFLIISPILSIPAFALSGAPSKPIAPSSYSGSTVTFQWNQGTLDSDEPWDRFKLEVSTSVSDFSDPLSTIVYRIGGGTWTYTGSISGCIGGKTYYARVRAEDGGGD